MTIVTNLRAVLYNNIILNFYKLYDCTNCTVVVHVYIVQQLLERQFHLNFTNFNLLYCTVFTEFTKVCEFRQSKFQAAKS